MKKNTPIKWILDKTKKVRLKMALLIIGNALFSVLSVFFAFGVKEVIDGAVNGAQTKNAYFLIRGAIFIGIIVLLQFLLRMFNNGLEESVRARLEIAFRSYVFSRILVKKYNKISGYHSGELINRLTSDVGVVSEGMTTLLPTIVASCVRLISALIALIVLDGIFALAFVTAGILVFLLATFIRGKLKSLHKKSQETSGKVRSFMQEIIENLLAVKVFSVNKKIEQKAQDLQEDNFKVRMTRRNYAVLGHSGFHLIFSAGYIFALIYGGFKIFSGILSYGQLSAILQLVNNVQVPFASLSSILPKYYAIVASTERLMEIDNIEDESHAISANGRELYEKLDTINVKNLTFSYDKTLIFKNANLTINKGDFVAVTGTSGIGKSTLMKLILGVYDFADGEIYLECKGEKIALDSSKRNLFAYVPQGNALFSGSVLENISFINSNASNELIDKVLSLSCCAEFIKELPNGLNTQIGEQGEGLSEGQVQRIAIARALISDAPVLLLDEATSALDEDTEKRVLQNLKSMQNKTVIIITHKKAALSVCNKKVKIKKCEIVENE